MVTLSACSNQHGWLSFERFETSIFSVVLHEMTHTHGMTHCEEELSESCLPFKRIYRAEWVILIQFTQFFWSFAIFARQEEILDFSENLTGVTLGGTLE